MFLFSEDINEVVVAIEVHMTPHVSMNDLFSISLFFLPTGITTTITQSIIESNGSFLFHSAMATTNDIHISSGTEKWIDHNKHTSLTLSRNAYIQFSFQDLAMLTLNEYSITLAEESTAVLTAWKLEGSWNGETWKLIDTREGSSFFKNRLTAYFSLPSFSNHYLYYRFYYLLSSTGTFSIPIAEIQFYIRPRLEILPTIAIYYPFSSYVFYPGQVDIYIEPVIDGFKETSIQPALPTGLSFSSHSGSIYGSIPSSASNSILEYTIGAKHRNDIVYSTVIQLSIQSCTVSYHPIRFTMTSFGQASIAAWTLRIDEEIVIAEQGIDTDSEVVTSTTTLCLQEGFYQLQLKNNHNHSYGWPAGTSLAITLVLDTEANMDFGSVFLPSTTSFMEIPLVVQLLSDGSPLNWYYFAEMSIPSDWNAEVTTSTWQSLPSSLTRGGSVLLLRKTMTISPSALLAMVNLVEMRIFCSPGLIIYINGQLVIAMNVPGGDLTPSTTSTKTGDPHWHIYSFSKASTFIRAGSNTLAIAIVHPSAIERVNDFKAVIILHAETNIMSFLQAENLVYNSVGFSANMHSAGHDIESCLDGHLHSYYETSWSSNQPTLSIAFSETRRDLYNYYCMTSAVEEETNDPFAWVLEESVNESQWNVLQTVHSVSFKKGETKCSTFTDITTRFFRIRITQVRNNQFLSATSKPLRLAELSFHYHVHREPVQTSLDYSQTSFIAFQHIPFSPSYSLNNRDYSYFTISPSLPSGLFIDTFTGLLFGTPTILSNESSYTITAKGKSSLTATVIISLQVVVCEGFDNTFSLLTISFANLDLSSTSSSSSSVNSISYYIHNNNETIIQQRVTPSISINQVYSQPYCLPSGYYNVQISYSIHSIIPSYSILLSGKELYAGTFDSTTHFLTLSISNEKLIHPSTTLWHYLVNATSIPKNWYQSSLSTTWPIATSSEMEAPSPAIISSYYCTTFHASYSQSVSGFTLGVNVRGGFIAYLNGVEISRVRMPAGDVTETTFPTTELPTASFVYISNSIQFSPFKNCFSKSNFY